MGLSDRLFARWYPLVAQAAEDAGLREMRRDLLTAAHGRTLEIGSGTGLNVPLYPSIVDEIVFSDPSPHMLRALRVELAENPPPIKNWDLQQVDAQALPFPDNSFDTLVSTLVQCSTGDPAAVLVEAARVLRPGGRYLFLEHVRSPDNRAVARMQDVLARPHRIIAAGCHPNRDLEALLDQSSLEVQTLTRGIMPRGVPTVRPLIWGTALAPA